MNNSWLGMIAITGVCAAVIGAGHVERDVSLESVGQIWADVIRDADDAARKLARAGIQDEVRLGRDLSANALASWTLDPVRTARAEAVGRRVLGGAALRRPTMPYAFYSVDSAEVNAFALPGGHIFVTRGMMDFVQSDAELAMVIGHEIAHVDLQHAISRYQFQTAAKRWGVGPAGQVIDALRVLGTLAYSETEELEADAEGFRSARGALYDPGAAVLVMERLQREFGAPKVPARTPAGELGVSVSGLVGDYFRTHPDSEKRARMLQQLAGR